MPDKLANILIVDDDKSILDFLTAILSKQYKVFACRTKAELYSVISTEIVDVVFLDILLGNENGFEILKELKSRIPEIEVIMISVLKDSENIVKAVKLGAFDYMSKDFNPDDVLFKISRALKSKEEKKNVLYLKREKHSSSDDSVLPVRELEIFPRFQKLTELYGKSDLIVIQGEKGVGKHSMVKELHSQLQDSMPLVVFLPLRYKPEMATQELFFAKPRFSPYEYSVVEFAHNGILYISDIDKTDEDFQSRLVTLIRKGYYVKGGRVVSPALKIILSSTAPVCGKKGSPLVPELAKLLSKNVMAIPPLKERKKDITVFAKHFLKYFSAYYNKERVEFSDESLEILKSYPWHYNISELRNYVESQVIMCKGGTLRSSDMHIKYFHLKPVNLKDTGPNKIRLKEKVREYERDAVRMALDHFKWNRKKTASFLSVPYNTFKVKIRNLKLEK